MQEKLIRLLKIKKITLATAESASAGYASYLLTKTAGASDVFKGGIVIYSLSSKKKLFKIPSLILEKTNGVSGKIAARLADKIKNIFGSDIGISLVGFAGPGGGKNFKAGVFFIAVSHGNKTVVRKITLSGARNKIRKIAAERLIKLTYTVAGTLKGRS